MADLDPPRQSEYADYGEGVGAKDFKFGVTGMVLIVAAAIVLAIVA
jgi:hypothetical protein